MATEEKLEGLFDTIAMLRRQIAFKNPLLDFNKILFLKHDKMVRGERHMVDQYLGFTHSKQGGNGGINKNQRSYSIPGKEGFRVSNLYKMFVENKHQGIQLTKEELRRITAWVDCNSNFYGAYLQTKEQAEGKVVKPLLGLPEFVPFEKLKR